MLLLINKPTGITSHDVVNRVRRITRERRVGHAGTLDPFASGLLIIAVGRETTKTLGQFLKLDKQYEATARLGFSSTTGDCDGEITEFSDDPHPTLAEIEAVLPSFIGIQLQTPPMFSAKKVGGKKLYELARKGITIDRKPNEIEIFSLTILNYTYPHLSLAIHCSSGTYIRTLVEDIAHKLGIHAYTEALKRTAIADYLLIHSSTLETL